LYDQKIIALISTTRAIVLNHLRYGDSSLIVNLYTESMGRQTIFVKGASGKKSPVRAALFQPLYLVEADLHHRTNRQMQRVSNMQVYYPFQSISFDPVKNCIALFIAEILHKTLKEEEANPGLFDFLFHTIQTLDLNDCGTANFHLLFLVHYSRYLGFYPNTEQASDHTWFDSRNGNFVFIPTASSPLSEYNHLLTQLFGMSFERLDRLQINHHQRNYLTEYLLRYYSMHVDSFGKLKSFPVLQNVFQD
jgi:DNA repair protein RecO (recombination protein O)